MDRGSDGSIDRSSDICRLIGAVSDGGVYIHITLHLSGWRLLISIDATGPIHLSVSMDLSISHCSYLSICLSATAPIYLQPLVVSICVYEPLVHLSICLTISQCSCLSIAYQPQLLAHLFELRGLGLGGLTQLTGRPIASFASGLSDATIAASCCTSTCPIDMVHSDVTRTFNT